MANSNPPVKGQAFSFSIALEGFNTPGEYKVNPTIATGDFKISKDGGGAAGNNLTTLPTPAAGEIEVDVTVSATEATADKIWLQGIDQTAPKEWADWSICILTTPA